MSWCPSSIKILVAFALVGIGLSGIAYMDEYWPFWMCLAPVAGWLLAKGIRETMENGRV